MTAIIETRNLTKYYKTTPAVKDVTFTVEKGEVIGFVGLNGAGKSTTINLLLGFQGASTGDAYLFNKKVTPASAHKSHRRIGFATGDMSLFDGMTGRQYLRFVARSYKTSIQTQRFADLVERFDPQLDKKLSTLSRGNKQKIALIAAFMSDPDLVILDEPSSGLDPLMQQNFLNLVREEAAKGMTVFMSSHYLNEVADVCSRILLIKDGQLIKDMPSSELELASGKWVEVITKKEVTPPKAAEAIKREVRGDTHTLQFVYMDKPLRLQEWIGTLPHLVDVTITDHNPEAAFEDLYSAKETLND